MHTLYSLKHAHTRSTRWLCWPVCVFKETAWSLLLWQMWPWQEKKEKEKHLILFPLSCAPITVFICPWADFNSAQQQESLCVCVTGAVQWALLSALQSISHTLARIHHTLDGGAHHNVTFNLEEPTVCSGDIMDWMMAGKWMMWLRSTATKHSGFWSFHLSGAVFKSWLSLRSGCVKKSTKVEQKK